MTETLARYDRQMLLAGFGEEAQRRLLGSTAVVLGCGALGATVADQLARAGVGRLVLLDRDFVELTNLQRQVLFDERDAAEAMPKAEAARRRLEQINSGVRVDAIVDDVSSANIERYAAGADVIVDGLDNFETRYLANDFAVKHGVPYVYGGAVSTVGTAFPILPHTATGDAPWERTAEGNRATPCLRCLFDEAPPPGTAATCDTVGVLGPAASIVASFEAAEALKILAGRYEQVCPTMLSFDLWANAFKQFKVARAYEDGDCPCCKHGRFDYLDGELGSGASTLCGRDAVQLKHRQSGAAIDLEALASRLDGRGRVTVNRFMLRAELVDAGKPYELTLFPDGRAIVKGTREPGVARGLYARYVGS